jgi:tetratricopeptide (TPR) repeat protein
MLPESAFAWAMRSWVAAELGSLDEAIDAGRHALDLDNRNATVHNTLGILDGRLAEVRSDDAFLRQRAMEHFREALRINPQHASAYVNLARELRHQGQHEKAMALYRRVLRLRPDLAEAHFNLGNLLAEQGDKEGAIDSYRQAIRARRDYVQAHFNLGVSEVR